ncbi:MAG: hypothetical protein EXR62_15970 [Chloroflexi bacterium]|nr:hypothetical protein [Chloroflexota bacterium]
MHKNHLQEKKRIQVYADPEIKRRIELAAAKHDMAVTEYCLEAIKQQLIEDDLLETEQIEIDVQPAKRVRDLITDLQALHADILEYRKGQLLDIDATIDQLREERDHELTGLH